MYTLLFQQVFMPDRRMFCADGGDKYLPTVDDTMLDEKYEMFGRALLKCLLEARPLHLQLPTFFYKVLSRSVLFDA